MTQVASSILIAGLFLALIFAVAYARALAREIREVKSENRRLRRSAQATSFIAEPIAAEDDFDLYSLCNRRN